MTKEAAQRALDVIQNLGGEAEEFRSKWLTVHAFASEFEHNNQRTSLIQAMESALTETQANEILEHLESEINYLHNHPVGNLQFGSSHKEFFQNAQQDIAQVRLSDRKAVNRLGHLICVVYQVRCNTEHGKKELGENRSQKLFSICNKVMGLIIPGLIREANAA